MDAIAHLSPHVHGIQLNIRWPERSELEDFQRAHPRISIILQIGRGAFDCLGFNFNRLTQTISRYEGLVDYLLFDQSGGRGRPLDLGLCARLLLMLQEKESRIMSGVTGGLSGASVHWLTRLLEICPDLSWDAESGLRDDRDQLDLGRCRDFLAASAELLR
jgi:hypothetical protein